MKLLIAGSRVIYPSLVDIDEALEGLLAEWRTAIDRSMVSIASITHVVSGRAHGVDEAGEAWAKARGKQLLPMPANWRIHGNRAGVLRNTEMAKVCDLGLLWWNGFSTGTNDMINKLLAAGKPHRVTPWPR